MLSELLTHLAVAGALLALGTREELRFVNWNAAAFVVLVSAAARVYFHRRPW